MRVARDVEAHRGRLPHLADNQQHAKPGGDRGVLAAHGGPDCPCHDDTAQGGSGCGCDVEARRPGDHGACLPPAQGGPHHAQAPRRGGGVRAQRPAASSRSSPAGPLSRGLAAAKVRFWVTMWPCTAPVSAARASLSSPLTGFQMTILKALAGLCTYGGQPLTRIKTRPAAPASWRTLRAVNQVSWVKSPYLMCPPKGLTAFGTRATNLPPGRSAIVTASKVATTSALVRCSSTSVAVTAANWPAQPASRLR